MSVQNHSFREEIFPSIQPEAPLVQLEAITYHSITVILEKETDLYPATTSFQVAVASDKVSPEPSSSPD